MEAFTKLKKLVKSKRYPEHRQKDLSVLTDELNNYHKSLYFPLILLKDKRLLQQVLQ